MFRELQDLTFQCMKCGNCQAVCQVYAHLKDEKGTARGKLAIIEALAQGNINRSPHLKRILQNCLNCYSCMAECPSKVEIEEIFNKAKGKIVYGSLLERLKLKLINKTLLTKVPNIFSFSRWAKKHPPLKNAKKQIGFYYGCMVDLFNIDLGKSVVKFLEKNGFEVVLAPQQRCCGIPLIYLGGNELAKDLALANAQLFKDVDTIVTVCPTCGHALKNLYKKLLPKTVADEFCRKVQDISVFLVNNIDLAKLGKKNIKVTYHDPCHLNKSQGIREEPRKILRAISGLRLIEMKDASACCGFGGTFSFTHKKLASKIGKQKAKNIKATGADIVASACPGCQMHIGNILRQEKMSQKVVHWLELLA